MRELDSIGKNSVKYICLSCHREEYIPMDVVEMLDSMDVDHDSTHPPQFSCEHCEEEMYPKYYKNSVGIEFKISDLKQK